MLTLWATAVGWICGLSLGTHAPLPRFVPLLAAILGGAALLRVRRPAWLLPVICAPSALLLGMGGLALPESPVNRGGTARITVHTHRTACGVAGCWADASLVACDGVDPDACIPLGSRLAVRSREELASGAESALLARLNPLHDFRNPAPDFRFPHVGAVALASVPDGVAAEPAPGAVLGPALRDARAVVRRAFDDTLAGVHAGIARALLLGEGNAVDGQLQEAIRNSGVSHILAVSGMHVTVLAGALVWLLRMLWLSTPLGLHIEARRAAAAIGVPLAPLVAAFAGGAPSAYRAAFMSAVTFLLVALGRRPSGLCVCAASVLIGALHAPQDALHPGFVLSVLATFALLTLLNAEGGVKKTLRESTRAWVATAPFLAVTFGNLQLAGIVANVVLAPVGAALIPMVVVHALCALALPVLSPLTADAFEALSGAFVVVAAMANDLLPTLRVPPATSLQALCFAGLGAIWLCRATTARRLWLSAASLCVYAAVELWLRHPLAPHELRATYLDVGQGDAVLIETGDRHHALIDAGGAVPAGPDPGQRSVLPQLRALRIEWLDLVVLSHPHPDHYGGLRAVFDEVPVREIWDTGQACAEHPDGVVCQLLDEARGRGTRVLGPTELCGAARGFHGAALEVLAPCPAFDEGHGENDNSLVVRLSHGARRFLFTGDVERSAEAALVQQRGEGLRADVLKVAHHGSRTSSTEGFLRAVRPWLSVVSAGRGNRFGHPHADVIERLSAHSTHVLRVDRVGGVRVLSDGERLRVDAFDGDVALTR